jgi:TPR repeat protein
LRTSGDLFVWPDEDPQRLFHRRSSKRAKPASLAELLLDRAEGGETWAMHNLALCYDAGHGVGEDPAKAEHWFREAALAGLPDSMFQLAERPTTDDLEAADWLEQAVSQEYVPAMHLLGERMLAGRGAAGNAEEALGLILEAAEEGYPPAMAAAGHCYDAGLGAATDRVRALYWYYKALSGGASEVSSAIRRLERNQGGSVIA